MGLIIGLAKAEHLVLLQQIFYRLVPFLSLVKMLKNLVIVIVIVIAPTISNVP